MTEYVLIADMPYERSEELFRGSEDALRKYIKENRTKDHLIYRSSGGREHYTQTIEGCWVNHLTVYIQGPDVRTYLE